MKYKTNDTIIDKDGTKSKILEVFTQTYVVTFDNCFGIGETIYTEK